MHGYSPYQAGKFQTQVNWGMAPGVEGDFCNHNVRTTVDAGPGGLVAHFEEGCIIARFAWLEYSHLDPGERGGGSRRKRR